MRGCRWLCLLVALLAVSACGGSTARASSKSPQLTVELTRRWWEWAASEPTATNPVADTTGADCTRNQPNDLFFLAGSFGTTETRRCQVPSATPVLIPALNEVCGSLAGTCGFPPGAAESVTLDGSALSIKHIESTDLRTIRTVRDNPVFPTSTGRVSVRVSGDWVLIPNLAAGAHALRARGSSGSFHLDVTYHLAVG